MEGLLGFLGAKAKYFLLAGGSSAALMMLAKFLPKLVKKEAHKILEQALNPKSTDPKERELIQDVVLSIVKLAEYKIPDSGLGATRKACVMALLSKWIPGASAEAFSNIIEQAVIQLDMELKEAKRP